MTESTAPEQGTDNSTAQSTGLSGLKLAQLQALAGQLGITGARRMRKSLLVEAIEAHQRGGAVAERDKAVEEKIEQTARKASQRHTTSGAEISGDDAAQGSEDRSGDASGENESGEQGNKRQSGSRRSRRATASGSGERRGGQPSEDKAQDESGKDAAASGDSQEGGSDSVDETKDGSGRGGRNQRGRGGRGGRGWPASGPPTCRP